MYLSILSDFNENWNLSADLQNNIQIPNLTKIRPVGADLFHADRYDEANSDFSQFCEKRPKSIDFGNLLQWDHLRWY
jgi:hypothetical protein